MLSSHSVHLASYHFYFLLCASLLQVKITLKMKLIKYAQDVDSVTGLGLVKWL
jgi:hypothetical protein